MRYGLTRHGNAPKTHISSDIEVQSQHNHSSLSPPPPTPSASPATWRNEANLHFADQLCYLLEEHYAAAVPPSAPSASASSSISGVRWSAEECWLVVWRACGHEMNETLVEDVRLGRDKSNLTECLTSQFGLTPALVASAAPPKVRLRPYLPRESPWPAVR